MGEGKDWNGNKSIKRDRTCDNGIKKSKQRVQWNFNSFWLHSSSSVVEMLTNNNWIMHQPFSQCPEA